MATHKLLLLPGDGIGPEVMSEVEKVVGWFNEERHRGVRERDAISSAARPTTRTGWLSPTRR